jgi:hypothetical protein
MRATVVLTTLVGALTGAVAATPYGPLTPFDRPGYAITRPFGVNDSGTIVGLTDNVGFIYSGGAFTTVAHPLATSTWLTGISNAGVAVGTYASNCDPANGCDLHSFIYENGSFQPFELSGYSDVGPQYISSDGRYVSGVASADGYAASVGFVYDRLNSKLSTFSPGPSVPVDVAAVNNSGMMAGYFYQFGWVGFAYDPTTQSVQQIGENLRIRDVNDGGTFLAFTASGQGIDALVGTPGDWSQLASAVAFPLALNNHGMVVGVIYDSEGSADHGFVASPIPEPAALLLLACGVPCIALAVPGRRRTSRRRARRCVA